MCLWQQMCIRPSTKTVMIGTRCSFKQLLIIIHDSAYIAFISTSFNCKSNLPSITGCYLHIENPVEILRTLDSNKSHTSSLTLALTSLERMRFGSKSISSSSSIINRHTHTTSGCIHSYEYIHSFISGMHHYECVAPNIDMILQSGRFWATSIASFREMFNTYTRSIRAKRKSDLLRHIWENLS